MHKRASENAFRTVENDALDVRNRLLKMSSRAYLLLKEDLSSRLSKSSIKYKHIFYFKGKPTRYCIVDFYIPKIKLVIKIDNMVLKSEKQFFADKISTQRLEAGNYTVLTLSKTDILNPSSRKEIINLIMSYMYETKN